jgi:hypothetical protein
MDLVNCPHCNLHVHTHYMYAEIFVCAYCKTPIARNNQLPVKPVIAAKPNEFNFDLMNKSFTYEYHHYKITGYIRYFYTQGYLYQWAAYNHKTYIWLCESLGNWFVLAPAKECVDIDPSRLRAGSIFSYKANEYTVDELSLFYTYYMEGELPVFNYTQTKGVSIECSSQNKLIHINMFSENHMEMYTGETVHLKDLNISLK